MLENKIEIGCPELKCLEVPYLPLIHKQSSIREISMALDQLQKNAIDVTPWPSFQYKPDVFFAIAHGKDCIFIKYFVQESYIKASCQHPNEPVYKDSCVEFFIAFEKNAPYYNFEFNCVGTCLLGFGQDKENRELLSADIIRKIRFLAVLKKDNECKGNYLGWELCLVVPLSVFYYHKLQNLQDHTCYINFFKCGDDLPQPHYLSWAPIDSPEPNFHLPDFFGKLVFK